MEIEKQTSINYEALIRNKADLFVLTNGKTLRQQISTISEIEGRKGIEKAENNIASSASILLIERLVSEQSELKEKKPLYERWLKADENRESDLTELKDYVLRTEITIEYLIQIANTRDYANVISKLDAMKNYVEETDSETAMRKTVIDGLKRFVTSKLTQKTKSETFINTLTNEITQKKKKEMTNEVDLTGTPLISYRGITEPVAKMISLNSVDDLLENCEDENVKQIVNEALNLLKEDPSFINFFCFCYAIKVDDPDLQVKSKAINTMSRIIKNKFGMDIQTLYSSQINKQVRESVTMDDLVEFYTAKKEVEVIKKLGGVARQIEKISGTKDEEKILKVALAYWELELNSNDEFLNPRAVLESLTKAMFENRPLTVRFVRSLRWCYPNKEVEIPPTAGDWETLDTEGKPLVRKESVEIEKLNIFRQRVLEPLIKWNIPVQEITLLSTGDYEMTGPGYEFSEDDERCVNARLYVEDVKRRLPSWKVFENLPFPYAVKTIKEFVQTNKQSFDTQVKYIANKIEETYRKDVEFFCGYDSGNLSFIMEKEDENRAPFIKWWNRKRSFGFTLYKTYYEMAVGWYISKFDSNTLLIVSGNRASGLPLSKGKQVDKEAQEVGVMSIRLINDGQVEKNFASKTQVI